MSSPIALLRPVLFGLLLPLALGIVAPAQASTAIVTASPGTLTGTGAVGTTVDIPAAGATGGASQVITQTFDPTFLRVDSAAQVTLPEGWTATFSSDGTTFGAAPSTATGWAAVRAVRATGTATGTAATGGTLAQAVAAPPSGTFSGTAGGDGWNVFFDDDNHVFNVWHHNGDGGYLAGQGLGAIDCHTRTGGSCGAGWPFYMSADGTNTGGSASRIRNTGVHSPGWVDNANNHLWIPTNANGGDTGFACIDLATIASPTWCGGSAGSAFRVLGQAGPSNFSDSKICSLPSRPWGCVDGLAAVGSRIYTTETRTGKVLCLDMAASGGLGAACVGQPYTLAGASAAPTIWSTDNGNTGSWMPALLNVNGKIIGTALGSYTDSSNPVLFCLDGDTGAACAGWATPKALPSKSWLTYAEPDATGAINGVCVRWVRIASPAGSPTCFTLAGASMTGNSEIAKLWTQRATSENAAGSAITVGSRVLWGNGDYNNDAPALFCSDAATNADCTGWPLTNYDNYTIVVDPANDGCFWTNSHAGNIKQVNTAGGATCAGIPPTSATFVATSLVTTQRVRCTGEPVWGGLSLTSPAPGTYTTATLTVLTAGGAVVTSGGTTWQNVPIVAGALDLSSLAQADTGTSPQFVVSFTGRQNSNDIATTITAPAYAPQLCTTLTAQEIACPYANTPAGTLSAWSSAISGSGTQAGAAVNAAQTTVAFGGAATTACVDSNPLEVSVTATKKKIRSGQRMRIRLTTANTGVTAATDTKACLTLPKNMIFVRALANGVTRVGRRVCFDLGTLAANGQVQRQIVVRGATRRVVERRFDGRAFSSNVSGTATTSSPRVRIIPKQIIVPPVTG